MAKRDPHPLGATVCPARRIQGRLGHASRSNHRMITHTPTALSLPLRTPRITARAPNRPPVEICPRFTTDGGRELEQHLARTCEKIAAGIGGLVSSRRLEGLLLAGGYGRGEGG